MTDVLLIVLTLVFFSSRGSTWGPASGSEATHGNILLLNQELDRRFAPAGGAK